MPSLAALFAVSLLAAPPSAHGPRLDALTVELAQLEATLPAEQDLTVPTTLIGVGAAGLAVGAIGAIVGLTTAPCSNFAPSGYGTYAGGFGVAGGCVEHREDWGLIAPMLALASLGAISLVIGVVQLVQGGAPYRRRDRLRRRIERLERSLAFEVSVTPERAAVSVSVAF